MNKKFLSAILFGALMVTSTGTFVSCKDYDDDIENLQGQINTLATKSDVEAKLSQLQSAIDAAKAEALRAAADADDSAEIAKLEAEIAALETCKCDVDAMMAKIQDAVDADMAKYKTEIETLIEEVEGLVGELADFVTAIDFQDGYDLTYGYFWTDFNWWLPYAQMPESWTLSDGSEVESIVFGKDMTGALTLSANETFAGTQYALLSVTPANAVITSDMLSLVNTKGVKLNDYIDLTVKPYEGLLTRSSRAAIKNGLYLVSASLKKNVTAEKLEEVGIAEDAESNLYTVRYAIAAEKDGRVVMSKYNVGVFGYEETDGIEDLDEASTIKSSIEAEAALSEYPGTRQGSTNVNDEECYPVVSGEAFTIKAGSTDGAVLASYVTVDINNAQLSTTDKAAINGLTIKGVKNVSMTGVHSITITGTTGVVVPLKLTAIGYDGLQTSAVVWVKAGNSAAIAQTASYVVTPESYVSAPTAYAYSGMDDFTVPTGATKMVLSIYAENEINIANTTTAVLNNPTLTFFKADGETVATAIGDIAKAQLNASVNLQTMVDDKVYEGTVKFYNAEGTFLGQSALSIQKVLPTTLPAGFSVKTNQLDAQGVYNCYLVPTSWTANNVADAVNNGTMDMDHVFNWGDGVNKDYLISFAAAKWDATNEKHVANELGGDDNLSVAKGYIDNETEHATTVAYNYGAISSALYDADEDVYNNYTIEAATFTTVFHCIYNDTYSWRWATHEDLGHTYNAETETWSGDVINTELVYGTDVTVDVAANIQGISSRDGLYSAKFAAPYKNSLAIKEAHLVSNANNEVDEYFKVVYTATTISGFKATQTSTETNPTAAVASTLVITAYDMYGHTVTIELPMTVKTR